MKGKEIQLLDIKIRFTMITTGQSKMKKGRSDACSLVALGFCRIDLDTTRIISVALRHDFKAQIFKLFLVPKRKIITKISTI